MTTFIIITLAIIISLRNGHAKIRRERDRAQAAKNLARGSVHVHVDNPPKVL